MGKLGAREYVGERQGIPLLFPPRPTYRLLLVLKDLLDFLIATDLFHALALNGALAKFFQKAIGPWKALQDGMGLRGCEEGWKTGTNMATLTGQEMIEMSATICGSLHLWQLPFFFCGGGLAASLQSKIIISPPT